MGNKNFPLVVAISALINNNKILLIKRARGNLVGLWGLPGGKVEEFEHLSEAAVREIFEETGIEAKFKNHLGFVSEHLVENGKIFAHIALHICELFPHTVEATIAVEGKLDWFNLDLLEDKRHEIIPSDFMIIEKLIKNRKKSYYNSVIEKIGDKHILKKFD